MCIFLGLIDKINVTWAWAIKYLMCFGTCRCYDSGGINWERGRGGASGKKSSLKISGLPRRGFRLQHKKLQRHKTQQQQKIMNWKWSLDKIIWVHSIMSCRIWEATKNGNEKKSPTGAKCYFQWLLSSQLIPFKGWAMIKSFIIVQKVA